MLFADAHMVGFVCRLFPVEDCFICALSVNITTAHLLVIEIPVKKSSLTSRSEYYDYEAFAAQLRKKPCIWALHTEG